MVLLESDGEIVDPVLLLLIPLLVPCMVEFIMMFIRLQQGWLGTSLCVVEFVIVVFLLSYVRWLFLLLVPGSCEFVLQVVRHVLELIPLQILIRRFTIIFVIIIK